MSVLMTREEMVARLDDGESRYTISLDKLDRMMDAGVFVVSEADIDEHTCPFCHVFENDCSICELKCNQLFFEILKAAQRKDDTAYQTACDNFKQQIERTGQRYNYWTPQG